MTGLVRIFGETSDVEGQFAVPFDPEATGNELAQVYESWNSGLGVDLTDVALTCVDRLGLGGTPTGDLCAAAARAVTAWGGHSYHSVLHHAEVTANAMLIRSLSAGAADVETRAQSGLLIASALAHDIYYDPGPPMKPRFAAERRSAAALAALAESCRVVEPDRALMTALIVATEPMFRSSLRCMLRGEAIADLPDDLALLRRQRASLEMAAILSDADMLSSVGLNQSWHRTQVGRLERELGRPIPLAEDIAFFDAIVGDGFLSPGGAMFDVNLRRIRQTL